jgi:hypothetical protein
MPGGVSAATQPEDKTNASETSADHADAEEAASGKAMLKPVHGEIYRKLDDARVCIEGGKPAWAITVFSDQNETRRLVQSR